MDMDEVEAAIPALRRYAHALLRDREGADDLVQDCLERAMRGRSGFRGDGPVKAWLLRILLNCFRDGYRRTKVGPVLVAIDGTQPVAREGGQDARLALREVQEAISRLPEDQRAALLLVTVEGMAISEAAELLSIPVGTLASRVARARAALRKMTGDAAKGPIGNNGAKP